MRGATFVVVLVIHALFFLLFTVFRTPLRHSSDEEQPPTALFFLPQQQKEAPAAQPPVTARAHSKRPTPPPGIADTAISPPPESPAAVAPTPPPDWRQEAQIAADHELEAEERKRLQPSPLAPHDFSGATPGSTDTTKPQFGWNHAATHRVEEIEGGGLLVNINDRCVVAIMGIFPFPMCRIGTIPARGDLFEHMKDPQAQTHPQRVQFLLNQRSRSPLPPGANTPCPEESFCAPE